MLTYDPDEIIHCFLIKVSSDRNGNLEKVLGERGKINQIGELIYKYMDVIKPETLFRLTFLLPEELWGIKFLLEYKPDLIEEYLDTYPDHISILIELNLHGYPEYHELIEKSAKKYITILERRANENAQEILEMRKVLRQQSRDENLNTPALTNFVKMYSSIEIKMWAKNEQLRNIKKYYNILARIKIAQPVKSELDKEWIIRYLIRADDYEDSAHVRAELFKEYYLEKDMYGLTIPIDLTEETIIALGNQLKQ